MQPPIQRLDVNDPADVQTLVDKGWAWQSGPKTLKVIFGHIMSGAVTRRPETETPEVTTYLDRIAPIKPERVPLEPGQVLPDPEEDEPLA